VPWTAPCALALVLGVATFGGCPGAQRSDFGRLPTITSDNPNAEADLAAARDLDERGEHAAAAERYRAFLKAYPGDPLVPVAKLALGRNLLQSGANAEAAELFAAVAQHRDPVLAEQGRFHAAVAAHRLGRHKDAVTALQPLVGRPIDPKDTALLLRTLGEALAALERHGEAIKVFDTLASEGVPEADRRFAQQRITELTRDKATPKEVDELARDLDDDRPAWQPVVRRALRDADAAGNTERAQELLEALRDAEVPFDDELSAIAMRAERPTEADPNVVGAVLSLSGRGRKVGELALRGLMLAAGLPLQGPPGPNTQQLVFRDDGGEPERAVEAVNELVSVHRAIAIVGPMDVRAAELAAARAQELGVPIVVLSPGGTPTKRGELVFRLYPTPDGEVSALLAAARRAQRSTVAALLPEGAYGDLMAATLRSQAERVGLKLGDVLRYTSGTTSFVPQAQALAKLSFDALLIADDARSASLIAPALAASGMWSTKVGESAPSNGRSITVLAPSVAYNPGLVRTVGRYLQGALFSVPFDAQDQSEGTQHFVQRFEAQFSEPPDAFAAFAHDAYRLIRRAVESGAKTRSALAAALTRVEASDAAGPSRALGPDREARTPTRILTLDGDQLVPAR
jgi:ABC-type branched-subunit amino acid transport system substrate-binding protein